MAADKATHQVNRRMASRSVKATLVVLGLIAAGTVALTMAEKLGQPLQAVATPAAQSFASTANNVGHSPGKPLSNEEFLSSNLNDKISSPMSGPRECRPEQGIVDDCTFH